MAAINANALITQSDVREIIDTDLSDAELAAYINTAYAMTIPIGSGLSEYGGDTTKAEIQKYIAAHLATLQEPIVRSERIAEVSVEYLRQTGANLASGLASTPFGQTALALDRSGTLAQAGLKSASFRTWAHSDMTKDVETYN